MSPQDIPFDVTHQKWNISVYIQRDSSGSSISGYIYPDHITCSKKDIETYVDNLYNMQLENGLVLWSANNIRGSGQPERIRRRIGSKIVESSILTFSTAEVK